MVKNKSKNSSLYRLLSTTRWRTFLRSPTQFVAVIFITALAFTLFIGLASNATWLENRVNNLYEGSLMADIWTTTTVLDDNDLNEINKIVGDNGATQTRYSVTSTINGHPGIALLSDDIPIINRPYSTDNTATENFFIIDEKLLGIAVDSGSSWLNDDGSYASVPVGISFASYRDALYEISLRDILSDLLGEETLENLEIFMTQEMKDSMNAKTAMDLLNLCVVDGGTNIFDSAYLEAEFQVTGTMVFAENVQSSVMNDSSFLLDRLYFQSTIQAIANANFALPQSGATPEDNLLITFFDLLERFTGQNLVDTLTNYVISSFNVNQYVTRLIDLSKLDATMDAIEDYFLQKETSNLLMIQDRDTLTSNVVIQNDISQAKQLAYIFPLIFFLVAILVVLTTLSQIILKDRTIIGTMKAIGISYWQIVTHYIILALSVIMIGVSIGVVLGPFVLPSIMNQKYAILYTLPAMNYVLAVPETIISILVVLLLGALVTFLIVRKEAKLKPAESMRPAAPKSIKKTISSTKGDISPTRISLRMAFRNIAVNIPKSIMVIIGVLGCTGLLVCGFGIDDTLDNGIKHDLANFYDSDITCTYASTSSKKDEILAIEGVKDCEEYSVLPTSIVTNDTSFSTMVYTVQDNSTHFILDDGYQLKSEIAVSNKVATSLSLNVGDTISFNVLGNTYSGTIGFINSAFYINGIYLNASYSNYGEIYEYLTSAWVDVTEGYDKTTVVDLLNDISGISTASTEEENREKINSYVSSISLMTLAVKIFAVLLAVIVLYNLALLNYRERIRDIATLKVLGFTRYEIGQSLGMEIMFLTTIGIFIGLAVGFPLQKLVLFVNQTPLVDFLYTTYPLTYIISFVLTFLTAFLVTIYLALKTRSIKMVESLKTIE